MIMEQGLFKTYTFTLFTAYYVHKQETTDSYSASILKFNPYRKTCIILVNGWKHTDKE